MAYTPVQQTDADPTSTYHDLTLAATPAPHLTDPASTPLSSSFHDVADSALEDDIDSHSENLESKISKFLSSLTSSSRQSYDIVEEDDYEVVDIDTPTLERHLKSSSKADMSETDISSPVRNDVPIRTASVSHKLAMNHPTPDLQSLQGAYVKNVERLEQSAQRLSMDHNLEEELQRVKYEQRRVERRASRSKSGSHSMRSSSQRHVSTRSATDSITEINAGVRPGGQSSAAQITSPTGSLKSPRSSRTASKRKASQGSRRSHELPEPNFDDIPSSRNLAVSRDDQSLDLDPRPHHPSSPSKHPDIERPTTSGSTDTYQQAKDLFTDFDGVHYAPDKNTREMRRISISRPPRARDSHAFREPQPGEEMIYYPAPVPVMLNLPVRLSRANWGEQEKRRLKALSGIPNEMRKSAAWLANEDGIPARDERDAANLPPQLRASAFFDHRATAQNVQLKDGSAVATLDSILDAAAHAPVSAFTDHPIAGHLGADFYGTEPTQRKSIQVLGEKKTKRKSSISNLLKSRKSTDNLSEVMARGSRVPSTLLHRRDNSQDEDDEVEDAAERSIAPDSDEMPDQDPANQEEDEQMNGSDAESEFSESQFRPGFSAAPTTLLAELQMRKAQQRSRNRTAADAFPNGMHSTLLELDTVAQLQQKSRRQKHIKLAWEDEDAVDKENYEDDDVPLGVLFPEKEQQSQVNLRRPLGLMEKKELEENEPLSHRRARLRGEPLAPPPLSTAVSQQAEDTSKPMLNLPGLDTPEDDDKEGETLAQRKLRMKNQKELGTSDDFARTLGSELGLTVEDDRLGTAVSDAGSKTSEPEETLGQRRKRLQAEAVNGNDQGAGAEKQKRSLADVLRANPIGYIDPNQKKTALLAMREQERARGREAKYLAAQEAERHQAYTERNKFGHGNQNGLIQTPFNTFPTYQQPQMMPPTHFSGHNLFNGHPAGYGYGYNHPGMTNQQFRSASVNPTTGMTSLPMNYPYQYPVATSHGYQPGFNLNGAGPPLDQKQRARIEGWRQGIM